MFFPFLDVDGIKQKYVYMNTIHRIKKLYQYDHEEEPELSKKFLSLNPFLKLLEKEKEKQNEENVAQCKSRKQIRMLYIT